VPRRSRITRARLQKLLHYDSKTGEFHWLKCVSKSTRVGDAAGTPTGNGYRKITIEGRQYGAHQLAWLYKTGKWCSAFIDHRDRNRSNNVWTNLRRATHSQNCANKSRHRNNRSGFKGVSRNEWGRWRASVVKNGQRHHLGYFATPQEAHAVYLAAARKLFGEFARTE
jgi:HNH endonuclease/AP2 domain